MALINSLNILETREDSQLCDALAREQTEQEELCGILGRFYDVGRPEEEKVSVKLSRWFSKFQKTGIKIGQFLPVLGRCCVVLGFRWSQAFDLSFEPSLQGVMYFERAHIGTSSILSQAVRAAFSYVETLGY